MLEILQYATSNFWVWIGTLFLILAIGSSFGRIWNNILRLVALIFSRIE